MTLSPQERQVLDDIERQFARDDPRLARRLEAFALKEAARPAPSAGEPEEPRRLTAAWVAALDTVLLVAALAVGSLALLIIAGALGIGALIWGAVRRVTQGRHGSAGQHADGAMSSAHGRPPR